jgi:1-acyl-sn-glycerol-3-phosphate acyltransferase/nucleoside-diphosphate-sugar epimerase
MANNVESRLNDALHNSVIFLTGVTGFVGKVTLARLLAVAPSLQRVYVLVRGRRGVSAAARFESVVLQSEALANVRELAVAKCVVLAGDASQAGVLDAAGVDASTRRAVFDSVDVILNCVGSLNYAEDLAAAVAANVRTAHHLIEFAQRIRSLRLFVHVSTAFVAAALPADSARPHSTRVPEQSDAFLPGIDSERLLARVPLMSAAQLARITPRVLGRFPNAHLFAKAVAEHLLLRTREAVPLLIVRPAHIGAAFADPLPGWIDSTRSIGAMVLLNGVGLVQRANVRADLLLDIVPVDFLANTLCAAAAAAMQPSAPPLPRYLHVASGARHPLTWEEARVFTNEYWRQHPSRRAIAPASLDFFSSELLYRMWFWASHDVPAATASIAATLVPTKANRARATELMHAADALNAIHFAFAPWRQHEWRFELAALPALMARFQGPRANVADSDGDIDVADDSGVPWDAAALDWRHYLGLFCYGVRRFMLGESDLQPPIELLLGSVLTKDAGAAQQQSLLARLFSDIAWARGSSNDLQYAIAPILSTSTPAASAAAVAAATAEAAALVASGGVPPANTSLSFRRGPRTPDDMMRVVLATDNVRAAIAAHPGGAVAGRREAENIIAQMGHTQSLSVSRVTAWFMRKVFRRLYSGIHVDRAGIARLREAVARGAVAFVPTHRSYVDFLLISYVCFEYNIPLPHIAAGEDFLAVLFVNWIFRNAGAFFIRRSFKDDPLYWEIFSSYVQTLVLDRVPVEFFIEGTRSRAGKDDVPQARHARHSDRAVRRRHDGRHHDCANRDQLREGARGAPVLVRAARRAQAARNVWQPAQGAPCAAGGLWPHQCHVWRVYFGVAVQGAVFRPAALAGARARAPRRAPPAQSAGGDAVFALRRCGAGLSARHRAQTTVRGGRLAAARVRVARRHRCAQRLARDRGRLCNAPARRQCHRDPQRHDWPAHDRRGRRIRRQTVHCARVLSQPADSPVLRRRARRRRAQYARCARAARRRARRARLSAHAAGERVSDRGVAMCDGAVRGVDRRARRQRCRARRAGRRRRRRRAVHDHGVGPRTRRRSSVTCCGRSSTRTGSRRSRCCVWRPTAARRSASCSAA